MNFRFQDVLLVLSTINVLLNAERVPRRTTCNDDNGIHEIMEFIYDTLEHLREYKVKEIAEH